MTGGIFIALGANLPSAHGEPRATLEAVIRILADDNIAILKRSSWWRSSAVPASDQPDFINGVIEIETELLPYDLLQHLHGIETFFGRVRQHRWQARTLDLDLIDYRGLVSPGKLGEEHPVLPHPRLQTRLFVLLPLQEIAPQWRHPVDGTDIRTLVERAEPLNINRL